jgi:Tol biopolymer transport system component
MMRRFERWVIGILLGLAGVIGLVIGYGDWVGLKAPQLSAAVVGQYGPIGLKFQQPMQLSGVEERLVLSPLVKGAWRWDGQSLYFWPEQPLAAGQTLQLSLAQGAQSADGRVLRQPLKWEIRIRQPALVFLKPALENRELWIAETLGQPARAVTSSAGQVFDFAVSRSGEQIVYSVRNAQQGLDLWLYERTTQKNYLVLPCAADECSAPDWSPDGKRLAYSRKLAGMPANSTAGVPQIYTLDLETGQTTALFKPQPVAGLEPHWSPDGNFLAFYDPQGRVIWVINLNTSKQTLLPSAQLESGHWAPDGKSLFFSTVTQAEGVPYSRLYQVQMPDGEPRELSLLDQQQLEASTPQLSADGKTLAVALRPVLGSQSKQLWLVGLQGGPAQALTDAQNYSHTAYRWSPDGSQLVYQRILLGSSSASPEVWVWNAAQHQALLLEKDATQPAWLP